MAGTDRRLEELRVRLEELSLEIHRMAAGLDGILEWVRLCPQCGRELHRREPMETVRCVCGWVWD